MRGDPKSNIGLGQRREVIPRWIMNGLFLPFMALSDGAHASTEDFSYFTLLRPARGNLPSTSLFGISCTRQMDASMLLNRPADVTRSTVQKAVVVIADSPQFFGLLRERLGRCYESMVCTTGIHRHGDIEEVSGEFSGREKQRGVGR
ncbi:hypothetical protein EYC84_011302 [Monilinia fructicola]|uniref:AVL9/DENND6 domain-containing protein n=1 Tax=Monilinia fructicola TaxID=38448 RepID=A0A5M9J4Y5_MONFR|nr:hypothetical protein EYC84_011302 [Monilinia fructicola]